MFQKKGKAPRGSDGALSGRETLSDLEQSELPLWRRKFERALDGAGPVNQVLIAFGRFTARLTRQSNLPSPASRLYGRRIR
jgi:hypothetical protein